MNLENLELSEATPSNPYTGAESIDIHDAAIAEAEANGLEVIVAQDNQLLLDIDSPEQEVQFAANKDLLAALWGIVNIQSWKSKSGIGRHVVIDLPQSLTHEQRIGLQAAMGSDGKREIIAMKRAEANDPRPSVLFKPKNLA